MMMSMVATVGVMSEVVVVRVMSMVAAEGMMREVANKIDFGKD
jgi:hypothetical protein